MSDEMVKVDPRDFTKTLLEAAEYPPTMKGIKTLLRQAAHAHAINLDYRDAQDAEIERLTAALATAEAERDAAVRALELAVESGDVLMFGRAGNTMTSLGLQPGHGYFVSYQGDLPDLHPSFRDAWDIFHRHAKDHPIIIAPNNTQQPAAAPAVDAAPVVITDEVFAAVMSNLDTMNARQSLSHASLQKDNADGYIEDGELEKAAENLSAAIGHILDALITMQKGETR